MRRRRLAGWIGPIVRPLLAVLIGLVASRAMAQEVLDRLLAVVEGQVITLSDVRAALALELLSETPQGADAIGATLNGLIDRELMLGEVRRYLPQEPDPAEVERRTAAIRARFPSEDAFLAAMAETAFTAERLTEWAQNDLRIEEYLRDRFAAAVQLTDEEVDQYLQQHQGELMPEGRSLADARGFARARLSSERRGSLVAEWLAGLRRRGDILNLYVTASD